MLKEGDDDDQEASKNERCIKTNVNNTSMQKRKEKEENKMHDAEAMPIEEIDNCIRKVSSGVL